MALEHHRVLLVDNLLRQDLTLRDLGAQVSYHIPVRATESHGVKIPALQQVLDQGVRLILTCDTGIDADEIMELAYVLRELLAKISVGLGNPDYNYVLRCAPVGDEYTRHQHWYMVVIPKISIPAGFEIGSGIYINTVAPEEAATFLREVETQ
jgi:hypothetical protein